MIRRLSSPRVIGFLVLAGLWLVLQMQTDAVRTLKWRTFDLYQTLNPLPQAAPPWPVVIIDIDEKSLATYGQWPWPRVLLADLVNKLADYDVAVIGFDMFFPEPDRVSPPELARRLEELPADIAARLRALPSSDLAFAEAIKAHGRVVLLQAVTDFKNEAPHPLPEKAQFDLQGETTEDRVPTYKPYLLRNIAPLERAANGLAIASFRADRDGVDRGVDLAARVEGHIYPSLALEMLRVATGAETTTLVSSDTKHESYVQSPPFRIQTDNRFRALVSFRRPAADLYVSAADVLDGNVDGGRLKSAFALVGTSAAGLHDLRHTPIDTALPGVEVHAQLLENVLTDSYLRHPRWAGHAGVSAAVLIGVLLIVLIPMLRPGLGLLLTLVLIGAVVGGSWYAFVTARLLLDATAPAIAAALMFLSLSYPMLLWERRRNA